MLRLIGLLLLALPAWAAALWAAARAREVSPRSSERHGEVLACIA